MMKAPETIVSILAPLKDIRAGKIEVEVNIELSDEVVHLLGPIDFQITFRNRPFNDDLRRFPFGVDSVKPEKNNRTGKRCLCR